MIEPTIRHTCTHCHSENLVKNGTNKAGNPQFLCKTCGQYGTLNPQQRYTPEQRETILKAYFERPSMRGIERIFGVSRQTLAKWFKKSPDPSASQGDLAAGTGG